MKKKKNDILLGKIPKNLLRVNKYFLQSRATNLTSIVFDKAENNLLNKKASIIHIKR